MFDSLRSNFSPVRPPNGPYELYVRSPALSRKPQDCVDTRIWVLDAKRRAWYLVSLYDVSRPQQNIYHHHHHRPLEAARPAGPAFVLCFVLKPRVLRVQ